MKIYLACQNVQNVSTKRAGLIYHAGRWIYGACATAWVWASDVRVAHECSFSLLHIRTHNQVLEISSEWCNTTIILYLILVTWNGNSSGDRMVVWSIPVTMAIKPVLSARLATSGWPDSRAFFPQTWRTYVAQQGLSWHCCFLLNSSRRTPFLFHLIGDITSRTARDSSEATSTCKWFRYPPTSSGGLGWCLSTNLPVGLWGVDRPAPPKAIIGLYCFPSSVIPHTNTEAVFNFHE